VKTLIAPASAPNLITDGVPLPVSGHAYTKISALFIEESGSINDVNLPNGDGRYNFVSQLTLTLIRPARSVMFM